MNKDDVAEELYSRINELKNRQEKAANRGSLEEVKEYEYRIFEIQRLINVLLSD